MRIADCESLEFRTQMAPAGLPVRYTCFSVSLVTDQHLNAIDARLLLNMKAYCFMGDFGHAQCSQILIGNEDRQT